ncbi:MAG: alpha/beta hydrolase [Lachnospiraceae bacterium]|nr:alpha/beta hydrolase [Lachnospiraceae bacterium]
MGKKIKFLVSSALTVGALGAAASETILYLLSNKNGDPNITRFDAEESDLDKAIERVREEDHEWLLSQELTHYYTTSSDGLKLHATYLPAAVASKRFALCIHGYRCNGTKEFDSISRFYHEEGVNCFMIDHRAHGESEGKYITYGVKESEDCIGWLKFMRREFGEDIQIILHGVSMGAATVMLMSGKLLPNNVVFAVSDCGYSTLKDQLYHNFKQSHLPPVVAYQLYRQTAKLHAGFDPDECNPIEGVENSNIPILFAHGEDDQFVPFDMVYANFDACPSPVKQLVTVPGAKHAQAFQADDKLRNAIIDMMDRLL